MAPYPVETVDLVVFTAAARLGSFSAAAAELRLSSPSVSSRLAALERRLGVILFERGARGSVLTPEGERFATYARRCLELLGEAVTDLGTERAQRLVLAAPASLGSSVFAPALSVLAGEPLAVHCRVAHSDEVVRQLLDGIANAGFLFAGTTSDAVRSTRVTSSPIVAVCSPDHALAARRRVRFPDLAATPVGVYRWGPEAEPLAKLFEHQHRPVHTIGLPLTAIRLALEAGHVAVVPHYAAARHLTDGSLHRLPLPLRQWKLEIRFAYLPTAVHRAGVTTLLDNLGDIKAALTA
ncbi:LysR family transcriptional regulator [Amycolatopsis jiangsuensis]|uniref:DNA-binding transcriptional LysR family regulator n=1 Tax=Amycolatopsis jiangsuensis TaxID=1181879 RepID=A0A840IR31_9PSEU|nr:LysR family transcriptional regulator [Amycolatopsis jiangsuensis]MBB4683837.1 DNA-binding transcriptional LysR family regulator [Amycolatopsis jiangsuensis]